MSPSQVLPPREVSPEDLIINAFSLVCPVHGVRLHRKDNWLCCEAGDAFSVVENVAVLVDGVRIELEGLRQPDAVIDALMDAYALPEPDRPAIQRTFCRRFSFKEEWIQVEADQFLNRVGASHEGLRKALRAETAAVSAIPINANPAVRISSIYKLSRLRPDDLVTMNLRVENTGGSTLSSEHSHPVALAYHWIDATNGVQEGHRTNLLADIGPGKSMTVPIFINTPHQSGTYILRIRALQENVRWFDESKVEYKIEIAPCPSTVDDPPWLKTHKQFDYYSDHQEGLRLIEEWRCAHFTRPVEVMVELGGNASPMLTQVEAEHRFNVDIDPFGMIIGKLRHGPADRELNYVVADGMALPFPPRSIDMLMMFATFHHFPDPVGLLARLADFVADDGLICVMCEPTGHPHAASVDADYVAELRRGVNEQSFALWEYQQMFESAGVDVVAAQIDVGSAKFALRPRR